MMLPSEKIRRQDSGAGDFIGLSECDRLLERDFPLLDRTIRGNHDRELDQTGGCLRLVVSISKSFTRREVLDCYRRFATMRIKERLKLLSERLGQGDARKHHHADHEARRS